MTGAIISEDGQVTITRSLPGFGAYISITLRPDEVDAIRAAATPDVRSKAHSLNDCWCGMPHRRDDFL